MFEYCADPGTLSGYLWWSCYLTTGKEFGFYISFGVVLSLLFLTVPLIMILGFAGALARRSRFLPLRWFGTIYTSMVRGVPDIIFFLFALIALDQGIEYLRHIILCPDWTEPIRQGNDFRVCPAAKMPLGNSPQWVHEVYGFSLAIVGFGVVFGAFAANTLYGALDAVPKGQLETGTAFGMSPRQIFRRIHLPQMWVYALPGLSNLWMILIKATPLLFLLGVEDIVYWARELGGTKTAIYAYPHGDWRLGYFLVLLVFYLALTWVSERVFDRLSRRVSRGQATLGGTA
ncbi:MAG: ABC transporter permease subunit [Rhodobacter sp.]|jgi:polar amino acid transport system permease protein|nr:ABC transporter permease subunit [Rhodobacter sp.]